MDTVAEKKVSTTKLVIIDTKTNVALSYVGSERGGEAHLPDPNGDDDFTAKELIGQLNDFREDADQAAYRAKVERERKKVLGQKLTAATKEYEGWFDRLVPQEEPDTFGL